MSEGQPKGQVGKTPGQQDGQLEDPSFDEYEPDLDDLPEPW